MNIQISLNFQCLNCFNHPPTTRTSFSRLPPPIAWIHIPTASMVVQSLVPPKPVETWAFDHSVWNLASDHSKSAHVDGSEIAANHATWILKACKITGEIYPSSTGDRRISSWRYKIAMWEMGASAMACWPPEAMVLKVTVHCWTRSDVAM